jgi:hypothetical protein
MCDCPREQELEKQNRALKRRLKESKDALLACAEENYDVYTTFISVKAGHILPRRLPPIPASKQRSLYE